MSTATVNNQITTPTFTATKVHLGFLRVLRSEGIKFFTLRSTWWTLGLMGLACFGADVLQSAGKNGDPLAGVRMATTINMEIGLMFMMALGVLCITNEYASGMIHSTLAAVPKRLPIVLAKAIVVGIVSFVWTLIINFGSSFAVSVINSGRLGSVSDIVSFDAWRLYIFSAVAVTGIAVISLGFGLVVRSTAAGITSIFALTFVIPSLISAASSEWILKIIEYLPFQGAIRLVPGSHTDLDNPWFGVAILSGWAIAAFAIGSVLLKRRDA